MVLDGILPGQDEVEEKQTLKLPEFIPREAIFRIESEGDVDAMPRGAIAHLPKWDDDLALDLLVGGATVTFLSRADHDHLDEHEDFDPQGFGVIDDAGLWLPGLPKPYVPEADGWRAPVLDDSEE